jgi:RNA polymerase sigma-70 factor (sigma-E family)
MSCPIGEPAATVIARTDSVGQVLDELYRQEAEYFGRVAFLLTDNTEQAEELVQEAFTRVTGRWRYVRDPLALRSYLRRTIVNLAIKGYRKRDSERAYVRRWGHTHERLATQPDIETRHQLLDVLRSLPARQRAVVVLRYYEDLPEKEIAEVLRCPLGTVKSSLSRALEAMKVNLEGEPDE